MLDNYKDIENLFLIVRNSIKREFKYFYDVDDLNVDLLTPELEKFRYDYNTYVRPGIYKYKVVFPDLLPTPMVDVSKKPVFTKYDYDYYLHHDLKQDWGTVLKLKIINFSNDVSLMTYCIQYIEDSRIKKQITPVNKPVEIKSDYKVFDDFTGFVNKENIYETLDDNAGNSYKRSDSRDINGCEANMQYLEVYKTYISASAAALITGASVVNEVGNLIKEFNSLLTSIGDNAKKYNTDKVAYNKYLTDVKEEDTRCLRENSMLNNALNTYFEKLDFAAGGCNERRLKTYKHPSRVTITPTATSPVKTPTPTTTTPPVTSTPVIPVAFIPAVINKENIDLLLVVEEIENTNLMVKLIYVDNTTITRNAAGEIDVNYTNRIMICKYNLLLKTFNSTTEYLTKYKEIMKLTKQKKKWEVSPNGYMDYDSKMYPLRYNMYILQKIINDNNLNTVESLEKLEIRYIDSIFDTVNMSNSGVFKLFIDKYSVKTTHKFIIYEQNILSITATEIRAIQVKIFNFINKIVPIVDFIMTDAVLVELDKSYNITDDTQYYTFKRTFEEYNKLSKDVLNYDILFKLEVKFKLINRIILNDIGFNEDFNISLNYETDLKNVDQNIKNVYKCQLYIKYMLTFFKYNNEDQIKYYFKYGQSLNKITGEDNKYHKNEFDKYIDIVNLKRNEYTTNLLETSKFFDEFIELIKTPFDENYNELIKKYKIDITKPIKNNKFEDDETELRNMALAEYTEFKQNWKSYIFEKYTDVKQYDTNVLYNKAIYIDDIFSVWISIYYKNKPIDDSGLREGFLGLLCIHDRATIRQKINSVKTSKTVNEDDLFYGNELERNGDMEYDEFENLKHKIENIKKRERELESKPRKKKKKVVPEEEEEE
jgi:hypothetical protein